MRALSRSIVRYTLVVTMCCAAIVGLGSCKKAEDGDGAHKRWKLTMIKYEEMRQTMDAEKGFRSGLADAGLREGIDFEIATRNAQGDIKTVLTLLDAVMVDGTDLLVSMQTTTFESAVRRRSRMPLTFMVVANPFVIPGVGTDDSSHNELLTGVYTNTQFDTLLAHIKRCLPGVRRIGSLATNFELNATYYKNQLLLAGKRAGLDVKLVGVQYRSSIPLDAEKLCQSGIDALVQIEDNLTSATFPTIAKIAQHHRIPVFSFVNKQIEQGAIMVYAPDYEHAGRRTAALAAKIIRGESPENLPFGRIERFDFIINLDAARAAGVTIVPDVLARADQIIDSQGR
ncbi:MAG: ABC transporter substrate-binding protein [Bacteroidota bacterium]|nr:ABC transporter substrate-binding protein [Bacteroidota bacterium]